MDIASQGEQDFLLPEGATLFVQRSKILCVRATEILLPCMIEILIRWMSKLLLFWKSMIAFSDELVVLVLAPWD